MKKISIKNHLKNKDIDKKCCKLPQNFKTKHNYHLFYLKLYHLQSTLSSTKKLQICEKRFLYHDF